MSDDLALLPLYVDWNTNTGTDDDQGAYCVNFGVANPVALEAKLKVGSRVIAHDEELRCEAILHRSNWRGQWLAVVISGTCRDLEPGEYERLWAATKRAIDEA